MNCIPKKRKYEVWTGKYISWRDAVHTPEEDSENFDKIMKKKKRKKTLIESCNKTKKYVRILIKS